MPRRIPADRCRIVFHGRLRKRFGPGMTIGVTTMGHALRAVCATVPGFEAEFMQGTYRLVRGPLRGGRGLDERAVRMRVAGSSLHIVPVAAGAKQGLGKTIIGAAIMVAAIAAAPWSGGLSIGATLAAPISGVTGALSFGSVALFGAAIMLGGISQMISPQPEEAAVGHVLQLRPLWHRQHHPAGRPGPAGLWRQDVGRVGRGIVRLHGPGFGIRRDERRRQRRQRRGGGRDRWLHAGYDRRPTRSTAPPSLKVRTASGAGGSGGKGGGGGGYTPRIANNTLRSDALVRIIDVISEGPIGGLVNGPKSIYLNGTPLQADDGTYNFSGVTWELRLGTPDQDPVSGYPAAEETVGLGGGGGVQITNAGGPVVQTFTSTTATSVIVTYTFPALYSYDNNGNLNAGPDVTLTLEVQPGVARGSPSRRPRSLVKRP